MCGIKQEELDVYRANAEALLLAESDAVIKNGTVGHASILIQLFLQYAQNRVVVFCNKLSASVYDTDAMQRAMGNALRRGVEVSIISQRDPESSNLLKLLEQFPEQFQFVQCHPDKDEFTIAQKNNFSVMDSCAFRFEPEHKQTKAFACMNDKETSGYLDKLFETMKSKVCGISVQTAS